MKAIKTIFFLLGVLALSIFYPPKSGHANSSGSPGGRSNSVGDNGFNCTQCHNGTATVDQSGYITSDIPGSGYIPGTTYNITLSGTGSGTGKAGFEFSAENSAGATAGTLIANTSSGRNRFLSTQGHITHTSQGNTYSGSDFSWTFQWTAPTQGTGDVTFSTSVLLANNNGGTSGDQVRTASLLVSEAQISSIATNAATKLTIYPNPTTNYFSISSDEKLMDITVIDSKGQFVFSQRVNNATPINITDLPKGFYFVSIAKTSGQHIYSEKLIKL